MGQFSDAVKRLRSARTLTGGREKQALERAGEVLLEETAKLLSKPGRGRLYHRPGRAPHRASAPGDPPARDRGDLIGSLFNRRKSDTSRVVGAGPHEAAEDLEYGNRERRIAPRPYARPALAAAEPDMTDAVAELLKGPDRE